MSRPDARTGADRLPAGHDPFADGVVELLCGEPASPAIVVRRRSQGEMVGLLSTTDLARAYRVSRPMDAASLPEVLPDHSDDCARYW